MGGCLSQLGPWGLQPLCSAPARPSPQPHCVLPQLGFWPGLTQRRVPPPKSPDSAGGFPMAPTAANRLHNHSGFWGAICGLGLGQS